MTENETGKVKSEKVTKDVTEKVKAEKVQRMGRGR